MIEQLAINIANYLLKKNSGYYKSIAKGVDGVAVDIVGQKVADVVKKHANTVTLSGLADGIPGGATVASTMLVASVWKMYYDINNILGISFSENFLKSVASGVASNFVGAGVSVAGHTVANAISAVPVAGTVIAATAGAATNRMACYSQATTYLKLLNKIVETGGDFSEESLQTVLDSCPDSSYTDYYDDDNVEEEAFYDDDDDSEWEAFNRRWLNYCRSKSDTLTASIKSLEAHVELCAEHAEECSNDTIGSCYYFMASWACYHYLVVNDDPKEEDYQLAHQMGLETINNAIDLLEDDEYLILKSLYELAAIDVEDTCLSDIMYIKECIPQISELENNLISEDYWMLEFNYQYGGKLHDLSIVDCKRLEEEEDEDVEKEYEDILIELTSNKDPFLSLAGVTNLNVLYRKRGDIANEFRYSKIGYDKAMILDWEALEMDTPVYIVACQVVNSYGACLDNGEGTPVDAVRAFNIFEKLYNIKYPLGISNLAEMYAMGKGVQQDISKAIELYKEAIEHAKRNERYDWVSQHAQSEVEELQKNVSAISNINSTSDEQEYVEMLQDCMADGEITEKDRRALDRLRRVLGISEKRAAEIEESFKQPQLTDDEAEYWEACKDAKADGNISERDRRSLDRLRRALGISEQRASEIELM